MFFKIDENFKLIQYLQGKKEYLINQKAIKDQNYV